MFLIDVYIYTTVLLALLGIVGGVF